MLSLAARVAPRLRRARAATGILATAAAIGLIAYPAIAIWYASDPHFFDNAEPTIVSVAWIYLQGAPLYHAVEAPERYSHIYGPLAFMVHAWALAALGPSIAVSKWLGVVAGLSSIALIHATLRRVCATDRALALTGLSAMVLLTFRHYSFWTRPDSLQLFCAALALFCATGNGAVVSMVIAGLASGVLWNLKITGVLYSLPVLVLIARRFGARSLTLTVAIAVGVAIAPFSLASVSLAHYVTWIRLSGQTGLLLSLVRQNLEWAAFLCAPLLLSRSLSGRETVEDRYVVGALALGVLLVVIAASKPGAGPYHLIPFVPVIAFVAGSRLGSLAFSPSRSLAAEAGVAWAAVLVLFVASQTAQFVTTMIPRRAVDDVEDVRRFLSSHDGIVDMGYGWTEARSLIRPLLTFRSGTYLIDQPAVREYQLQKLELPTATIDAVRGCRVGYWLVPRNEEPFSGINVYPSVEMQPLYPRALREAFAATHRLIGTTKHYDVWKCLGQQ